jgi:toxin-antitoxin system PIN domain toxin
VILPDVNVLVYAFREDADDHVAYRRWLEEVVARDEPFALADVVLSGFLRVATHPRVFREPAPIPLAVEFVEELRRRDNCVVVAPGRRHWALFTGLCVEAHATGNLVPDAYLAALAIESGCQWITTDLDYARFPGLRWRHPLREEGRGPKPPRAPRSTR